MAANPYLESYLENAKRTLHKAGDTARSSGKADVAAEIDALEAAVVGIIAKVKEG